MRFGLSILLFAWVSLVYAQSPRYTKTYFNQFDGLLTQTISSIAQDADGRLLLGSENGLFLFDGKHFTRPPYHNEILSKRIDDIIVIDEGEYLLLGGNTNVVYFIRDNKVVWKEAIEGARNIQQLVSYVPSTNTLFFKRDGKLYKKAPRTSKTEQLVYNGKNIISFSGDYAGHLYVWDSYDLIYIKDEVQKAIYTPTSKDREWAEDLIWRYLPTENNNLLAWGQDTIMTIKDGQILAKVYHETPDHLVVRNAKEFEDGTIWFATQSSDLLEFDGKQVFNHKSRFKLNELAITSAFKDENGTIWLGTIGKGLLMIRPSEVIVLENSAEMKINCFAENEDHLLVGTKSGIYQVNDTALQSLTKGTDFDAAMEDVFFDNYTHQLNYHEGYWLVSTMRTRIKFRYVWELQNVLGEKAVIKNGPSSAIFNGAYYNGFWGSFSIRTVTPEGIGTQHKFKPRHQLGRTNDFLQIQEGVLAVCDYGIYLIEQNNETIDTTLIIGPNVLGKNNIYNNMIVDSGIWYVSTSNGVYQAQYRPQSKSVDSIEQLTFIESNALCQTPDGTVWSGTSKGLLRYSKGEVEQYSISEDIDQRGVSSLHYSNKRNRLFVGTSTGLYHFDPAKKKSNDKLFKLLQYTIKHPERDLSNFTELKLNSKENTFSIEAGFLNFLSPNEAYLAFSINNQAPQVASNNKAVFNSLKPGVYEFTIWGETGNGQKTNSEQFRITVLRPFWLRTEGILLALTSFGLLFWIVSALRLRQVRKRARQEHETQLTLNQLERKALNLSLNPHFLFNSLNSIQSRISQHDDEDLVNYIADFSNLMRKTLENSEQNTISLEAEVEILRHYLRMEQRRYRDRFDFEIKLSPGAEELEAEIPPMLLQPFVENSIIHGILPSPQKGLIVVHITQKDDFVIFEITDNGVGIKANESGTKHQPKAIEITKKRIMLMDKNNSLTLQNISDFDSTKSGARIVIKLKVLAEVYK